MSTFSTAITGLKAYQTDLGVIGNNIANANTTGYKASRAQFSDLLVQTLEGASAPTATTGGTDPLQMGAGVIVSGVLNIQTQGAIEPTGRSSDLAIQGEGFYVLGNGDGQVYTRVGTFELDANGNLVDSGTGLKVQGLGGNITIPLGSNQAKATTNVVLVGNLDATAQDNPPLGGLNNETALDTSFFIIDSLGGKHQMTVTFTQGASADTTWDYVMTAASAGADGSTMITSPASGAITFSGSDGTLLSISGPGNMVSGGFDYAPMSAAASGNFTVDFSKLTEFAALSNVAMKSQDGVPPGSLTTFNIGSDGKVNGVFSNGLVQEVDTLKLATFSNPSGLLRFANGQFAETPNSGVAQFGAAGTGGKGTIVAGALEQSNVDLGTELVNLIIAQRGYEANAKVISVADLIQQTTLNLLR